MRSVVLVALAACYAHPADEACAVQCPCPSGLVCGGDGLCKASVDVADCTVVVAPTHRRVIQLPASPLPLFGFPLLVRLVDDDALRMFARPDGSDLAFFDAAGAQLPFDIESYADGTLVAWVRVDLVDPQSIELRYGGSPVLHDPRATWAGLGGVWHLADTSLDVAHDATAHAHGMAKTAPRPTATDGAVGPARAFVGGRYVTEQPDVFAPVLDSFTWTAWIRLPAAPSDDNALVYNGAESPTDPGFSTYLLGGVICAIEDSSGQGASIQIVDPVDFPVMAGQWIHIAGVVDRGGSTLAGYVNGNLRQAIDINNVSVIEHTGPFVLGGWEVGGTGFDGALDEVRLYPIALPQEWFAAEYGSVAIPDFVTIGPDEPLAE